MKLTFCLLLAVLLTTASTRLSDAQRTARDAVHIVVAADGDDNMDGSPAHPVRSLTRAQALVRRSNSDHDVVVELRDGTYRITAPLRFTAEDGGREGHTVVWVAAQGAHPVLSGGMRITGWHLFDRTKQIYVADVPKGLDSRQLWVNDELAPVASIEIDRKNYTFTREGMIPKPGAEALPDLNGETRLELRATGFFTARISPVARVENGTLIMRQPAWDNNLWGYDTIEKPFHPELQHLYLANSLKLLHAAGEWYLDPAEGKLYLRPARGTDLGTADVELPRLEELLSVGDSLDLPIHDLGFDGLRFSYTTWLGPTTEEGYASQQSGSYLAGRALAYPADPIGSCAQGCRAFESVRNEWRQMPSAVQVSAAERISFDHDVFAHLGQYALGIGNDADATLSGTGLATGDVTVNANVFTDCAGGAILAGGVRREAHHPSDPRQINRQLIIRNNRIQGVSRDFLDNSAILSTYVTGAVILHNDISDVPYDAIDIGYGWGMHDPGGNPNYRVRMHGYDWKQNLVYTTPTTHRDVVVASNRIHDAKKLFHDGGAIYNLSASPGTLITENYISDNHGMIALYLDEGSRYIVVRRNVVDDPNGEWLNVNTVHAAYPLRISPDNTASDNWHNGTRVGGMWTNYENDLILDDHLITDHDWPSQARDIMQNAGIEPGAGPVAYETARPEPATVPGEHEPAPHN